MNLTPSSRARYRGDLSYPDKKNSLLAGVDAREISRRFGWIKTRDAFSDPFTPEELEELRQKLLSEKRRPVPKLKVPKELKHLVAEARAMVYLRTLRTDILYELLFLARPITESVGREFGIPFKELADYSVYDLLAGKPVKYPPNVTCAYYKDQAAFFTEPIFKERTESGAMVKGAIAYRGTAHGPVRVVRDVGELHKVAAGDILVTHMTTPSFMVAMQKAAANLTAPGGINCHPANVARALQKPSHIGPRTATKVLKDGDMVEVDANTGVVKILERK